MKAPNVPLTETIDLLVPVEVDGKVYETLTMRRPKVADQLLMSKLKGSDDEKEVRLFANLCEESPEVIKALDLADYMRLQETYRGFLSYRNRTSDELSSSSLPEPAGA